MQADTALVSTVLSNAVTRGAEFFTLPSRKCRMDDIDFHSLGLHTGSSASLLKYYQDKIRRFDEERKSQLQRIADVEVRAPVGGRWTSTAEFVT